MHFDTKAVPMIVGGHAPFSNVGTHFSARRRNHVEMYRVSFTSTWNQPWRQRENHET
jgi:hypothetical protein